MKVNGKEIKWEDTSKGYYMSDVKTHVLWRDEKTGASLVLLRAPKGKGWDSPHSHPEANEWTVFLTGDTKNADGSGETVSADNIGFGFAPKGETHGSGNFKVINEVMWLRYLDGPSTIVKK